MKFFIVFGSKSDEAVATNVQSVCEKHGSFNYEVLSAHRNPVELGERLDKKDYDVVIAGAGLAAHLPGVVASKVTVPVLGMPVKSQFDGLDAFASIVQMPSGVPVLGFMPEDYKALDQTLTWMKNKDNYKGIHICSKQDNNELIERKLKELRELADEEITMDQNIHEDKFNIYWGNENVQTTHALVQVPYVSKEKVNEPMEFMNLFNTLGESSWGFCGVNNLKNAYLMIKKIRGIA